MCVKEKFDRKACELFHSVCPAGMGDVVRAGFRRAESGDALVDQLRRRDENSLDPITAYNAFAPFYKRYAEDRRQYLRKVENMIAKRSLGASSLLDVGAGDGSRALRIAQSANIPRVLLIEPSSEMRALCSNPAVMLPYNGLEIPETIGSFEVITCLWNVLGHVQGMERRIEMLAKLRRLLSASGTLFLDVSHRYNAVCYGWSKTLLRLAGDALLQSSTRGDVIVSWRAGERTIRTYGHFFTHSEMEKLFRAAGLTIVKRWVINYDTGAEEKFAFRGQLLYQLVAA